MIDLLVPRPDRFRESHNALMAAALAADFEHLLAAQNGGCNDERGRSIAANELPRVPFLTGQIVGFAESRARAFNQAGVCLLGLCNPAT